MNRLSNTELTTVTLALIRMMSVSHAKDMISAVRRKAAAMKNAVAFPIRILLIDGLWRVSYIHTFEQVGTETAGAFERLLMFPVVDFSLVA